MSDDGWSALILLVLLCSIPQEVWGWIFISLIVIIAVVIVVAIVKLVLKLKERKMSDNVAHFKPQGFGGMSSSPSSTPDAVDAKIIKVENIEPTFGTSLNQTRRDHRPDMEGIMGLKRIMFAKIAGEWQLHNEKELAIQEADLRHDVNMVEIKHAQIEKIEAINATLEVQQHALNEVVFRAKAYAITLKNLGIDDPEIEMKVKRILMQALDQLGLRLLDTDIHE